MKKIQFNLKSPIDMRVHRVYIYIYTDDIHGISPEWTRCAIMLKGKNDETGK